MIKGISLISAAFWLDAVFISGFALLFFIGVYALLNLSPYTWVDIIHDDAYYYLGVARSMVERQTSSFAPPFATNGYQPLWLWLLSLQAFVFGTGTRELVLQAYTLNYGFILAFILMSRRWHGAAFPAVIAVVSYAISLLNGMESAMMPAFFLLFMQAKGWRGRGIYACLLFLTRIDALAVVFARDVYRVLFKREYCLRHYYILLPLVALYLALNYALFGIPVPVSGLQKSVGMVLGENWQTGLAYLLTLKTSVRLFFCLGAAVLLQTARSWRFAYAEEIFVLTLTALVYAAYYGLLSGWPVWHWYYWPSVLLIYYLLLESWRELRSLWPASSKRDIMGIALLLLSMAYTVKSSIQTMEGQLGLLSEPPRDSHISFGRQNVKLADWARLQGLPKNTFFAMGDRAGSLGFFLGGDFRFFHAEGLVGDAEYYRAMKQDQGLRFVNALDVNYWVAERENYLKTGDVIGVIEPVQALSAHVGPYMLCFPKSAIVLDQSYAPDKYMARHELEYRYVFDFKKRVECPAELNDEFEELKSHYGGVRTYSLPVEVRG